MAAALDGSEGAVTTVAAAFPANKRHGRDLKYEGPPIRRPFFVSRRFGCRPLPSSPSLIRTKPNPDEAMELIRTKIAEARYMIEDLGRVSDALLKVAQFAFRRICSRRCVASRVDVGVGAR
jgi:hypothetical protein